MELGDVGHGMASGDMPIEYGDMGVPHDVPGSDALGDPQILPPQEAVVFPDEIVDDTLSTAANLAERIQTHQGQAADIARRIGALMEDRQIVTQQSRDEMQTIARLFPQARRSLWEHMPKTEEGHAAGTGLLVQAVRLSPPEDSVVENPEQRDARVAAAREMSDKIHMSQPALIRYDSPDGLVYCAAVPMHDGFSVHLDENDVHGGQFMVGVGSDTRIPLTEAWRVLPGDLTGSDTDVQPAITVHTGEKAADYLIKGHLMDVARLRDMTRTMEEHGPEGGPIQNSGARQRFELMKARVQDSIVEGIMAAQAIEAPLPFDNERELLVDTLRNHLFNVGDSKSLSTPGVIQIGRALQAAYPADAEIPLAQYIAQGSHARLDTETGRLHHLIPVRNVLVTVCGLTAQDAQRLLRRR